MNLAPSLKGSNLFFISIFGGKTVIEIKNVSRYFGDHAAVNQLSFSIRKGEILGLLGHNGAGKTTLMKMLTGFLEPSEGEILIDGQQVTGSVLQKQKNIGYLPESSPLYPEMTVIDYLDYAATIRSIDEQSRPQAIRDVIHKTKLKEKAFQKIETLSRGYRQRVGVAQALLGKPSILILDEPTNGLDPAQTQHMRELILSLKDEATVILSTHIMQEVKAMCDRVVVLGQGALALDAPLNELMDSHKLQLRTDASSAETLPLLKQISSVKSAKFVKETANQFHYLVEVKHVGAESVDRCTAELIKELSRRGFKIFGIEALQFDLERVLEEIKSNYGKSLKIVGGYDHAA